MRLAAMILAVLAACTSQTGAPRMARRWFARCTTAHGYRHFVAADSAALADALTSWHGRGLLTHASTCVNEPEWP